MSISIAVALLLYFEPAFIAVIAALAVIGVAMVRFEWVMYASVLLLPFYPLYGDNLYLRDTTFILRCLAFFGVWNLQARRQQIKHWLWDGKLNKAIWLFGFIALLSVVLSSVQNNLDAYKSLRRLFSYFLLYYSITGWVETREQARLVIKMIVGSTIVVALFGFCQMIAGGYTPFYYILYPFQQGAVAPWQGRIVSFLYHFNSLAAYLNLVIPFAIGMMLMDHKPHWRRIAWWCFVTGVAALYFTFSRGGLLALIAVLALALWYLLRSRAALQLLRPSAAVLAIVLILPHLAIPNEEEQVISGTEQRLNQADDFTTLSRLALWAAAGMIFMDHPILGIGYGNYHVSYEAYFPRVTGDSELDSHNLYLQLLSETGVLGFVSFLAIAGMCLSWSFKLLKNPEPLFRITGFGGLGAISATLVHGCVDYVLRTSPQFGGLFFVVLALITVMYQISRQAVPELSPNHP